MVPSGICAQCAEEEVGKLKERIFSVLLLFLFLALGLFSSKEVRAEDSFSPDPQTPINIVSIAEPDCIVPVEAKESIEVLKKTKVSIKGATLEERQAIASAIKSISLRSGGELDKIFHDMKLSIFDEVLGSVNSEGERARLAGRQTGPNSYELSRQATGDGTEMTAYLIHEFGHRIGGLGFYKKYNKEVDETCELSVYSTHRIAGAFWGKPHRNRNEEFAEDFAAFTVAPQYFLKKCPEAYRFFEKWIYVQNQKKSKKARSKVTYPYQQLDRCIYPVLR